MRLIGLKHAFFIRLRGPGLTLSLDWLCEWPKAHFSRNYDISSRRGSLYLTREREIFFTNLTRAHMHGSN